ncbi:IS110 family RNA-guided transposase [Rhodocaloribacter sp.]
MEKVLIGIDIAKDKLDLALLDGHTGKWLQQTTVANTARGHAQVLRLSQAYASVHLVMEATGTYHLRLVQRLCEAGLALSVINPLQLKRFAQMKLRRLKTDRSDAQLLAQYGREQKPPLYEPQPVVEQQLKQINTHLRQLIKQRTALKNMLHANGHRPTPATVCDEVLHQTIEQLDRGLSALRAEQERLVKAAYAEVRVLIESVKGVGPRTAIAVLAYLGTLTRFKTHKQVSAYIGINPVPRESGTSLQAKRHISKQGQAQLRTLFYECALSASQHNRVCRALYERLKAAGKPKKVALIAVANKLVKQVFTVVKTGVAFDDNYLDTKHQAA